MVITPLRLKASKVIHVFVVLADNAHQGIIPVPAKIGDGDKPDDNLYWGCDEGVRAWFSHSDRWKKLGASKPSCADILDRVVFKHSTRDVYLIADAWRGQAIKACTVAFASASAGEGSEAVGVGDLILKAGGEADLVAYIGHNGLMDFGIDWPSKRAGREVRKPVIVLCCISGRYFGPHLRELGADPLLTTTQLMYPGAFILHDALEVWLAGGNPAAMTAAAGKACAKNQHISFKAASGVFSGPP